MFKQGAVVLIPFPFTDLSASKVRPAVIVSKHNEGDDVVVAFISSQKPPRLHRFDVLIADDGHGFASTGLKTTSVIKAAKLATLDKKIILGELGALNPKNINVVCKKLGLLFGY